MDTNIRDNDAWFPSEGGTDLSSAELSARRPSQQTPLSPSESLFKPQSDGQWWSDELHDQFSRTAALVTRVRALDPRQAGFTYAEQNDETRGVQLSRLSSAGLWFPLNNADHSLSNEPMFVPDELMREMWGEFSDSWQELQRAGSERLTDSTDAQLDAAPRGRPR